MLILESLLLMACVVLAWQRNLSRRVAGGVLMGLAAISSFGGTLLRSSSESLQFTELPAYFDTTSIILRDGQRFAFNPQLQRVQRYSPDGTFELGWFVHNAAGVLSGGLSLGLTANDQIVIASKQTMLADIYSADGLLERRALAFQRIGSGTSAPAIMLPVTFKIDGLSLVHPVRARNPSLGWRTLLPGLFLHSWVAWLLCWAGLNLILPTKNTAKNLGTKTSAPASIPKTEWKSYTDTPHNHEDQVSPWEMGGHLACMFAVIILATLAFVVVATPAPALRLLAGP
jgi:disulfide bond formation protein DsbB